MQMKAQQQQQPARTPLGGRGKAETTQTVVRIVGAQAKAAKLDVAAFQSFADSFADK